MQELTWYHSDQIVNITGETAFDIKTGGYKINIVNNGCLAAAVKSHETFGSGGNNDSNHRNDWNKI